MKVSDLLGKVTKLNPKYDLSFTDFVQLYDGFIEYDIEDINQLDGEAGYKVWVTLDTDA